MMEAYREILNIFNIFSYLLKLVYIKWKFGVVFQSIELLSYKDIFLKKISKMSSAWHFGCFKVDKRRNKLLTNKTKFRDGIF